MEWKRDEYTISTDPQRLDVAAICAYLQRSYWAAGRPEETIRTALHNSLCFGLYQGDRQVGLARIITDYATFFWLCDVYVLEEQRGRGLGKWLVACVLDYPGLKHINGMLATRDAHGLYRAYGFTPLEQPAKWMRRPAAAP
ncbi:MAG: GNAT family N-acetyltransferase [Chloroflexi bacterium]|jgi:GNAT superfamily N-acetyltransferase|nr:GNAT family N-acetyltransferase [Anaerolineaceae bacterium]NMB91017.1 GNAT family N-acetyltransferase [Chloroflexota bacterium]